MGTAGPLSLARGALEDGRGSPFLVLNRYFYASKVHVLDSSKVCFKPLFGTLEAEKQHAVRCIGLQPI